MQQTTAKPYAIASLMFGLQVLWGALLGISLQSRAVQLAPGDALVQYGHLAAAGAAVAAVVQIVAGYWSDLRRGRGSKRNEFYIVGVAGGAVALAAFYSAGSFSTLMIAYLALQATINIAIGPYQAIIPDFIEPRRMGVASSWLAALQSAGNAVGAVLASTVADLRVLAASIDALLLGSAAVTIAHVRGLAPVPQDARRPALRSIVTKPFVDLFISRGMVYVGFFTLVGYLFFYVNNTLGTVELELATRQTGLLILLFTIVGAVGAVAAARPSDRFDKRLVASIGGAVTIAALMLFVLSQNFILASLATCVAGVGWGVFLVADWALACRIMPPGGAGTTMGIWNLALILPQVAAPSLTTWVLTHTWGVTGPGAPREAFVLAALETLFGICWLWRLSRQVGGE